MKVRIGARGSTLSIAQTELVAAAIRSLHPAAEIITTAVRTTGDKKQGTPAAACGDKKEWIYEIEMGLIREEYDLAIHSAKDVPIEIESGTTLSSVLKRDDSRDVFVGKIVGGRRLQLSNLRSGALIGVSSLRRQAELKIHFPELRTADLRGNVPTRLEKLERSDEFSGTILAAAGLLRLGYKLDQFEVLESSKMLPAVNQGVIAAQCLETRSDIRDLLAGLSDTETQATWLAERECIARLGADCHSAVGVLGTISGKRLTLQAKVFDLKSTHFLEATEEGHEPLELGALTAERLLTRGAAKLLLGNRCR